MSEYAMEATMKERQKMAEHVLEGKPLVYGVKLRGDVAIDFLDQVQRSDAGRDMWVRYCTFDAEEE